MQLILYVLKKQDKLIEFTAHNNFFHSKSYKLCMYVPWVHQVRIVIKKDMKMHKFVEMKAFRSPFWIHHSFFPYHLRNSLWRTRCVNISTLFTVLGFRPIFSLCKGIGCALATEFIRSIMKAEKVEPNHSP